MADKNLEVLTPNELKSRAIRFYNRYGKELEQIAELLKIKLKQIALAYTINNKLPPETVKVSTRVKTIESFLNKLESDGWPTFYYPTEVIKDLIGARIVCAFVDDCYGLLNFIQESHHFEICDSERFPIKDFIKLPQEAGYRGIHLYAEVVYDTVVKQDDKVSIQPGKILSEIQIRTRLQDAWGDITHEFFYKAKMNNAYENAQLETFLSDVAQRLSTEDKTLMKFRNAYQKLSDEKVKQGTRVGFKDEA